jgi:hypothetical protein
LKKHIRRLDVAMHHASGVDAANPRGDLLGESHRVTNADPYARGGTFEVTPGEEGCHDKPEVAGRDDVRVDDVHQEPATKMLQSLGLVPGLRDPTNWMQHFQSNLSIEMAIVGHVNTSVCAQLVA